MADLVRARGDAFTNRARTTLALGLVRLHLNELDEQRDYQRVIRRELEANGGTARALAAAHL